MKALAIALGISSLKRLSEVCSASSIVAESSSLVIFDPGISERESSIKAPCSFESAYLLKSDNYPSPEKIEVALKQVGEQEGASIFIFNDSPISFWIAPLLAGELKLPIVTDAVKIRKEAEGFAITKPVNEESVWADYFVPPGGFVAIIRRGFPSMGNEAREVTLNVIDLEKFESRVRVLDVIGEKVERLEDAEIVVGMGDGIRQSGTLSLAIELARLLKAEYACTKPLVESGAVEMERLVGISGKRISPKVYIAMGISGSSYHIAGISSSQLIVSVNIDRGCAMNRNADFYYVGDLKEVIPKFIELLKLEMKDCSF